MAGEADHPIGLTAINMWRIDWGAHREGKTTITIREAMEEFRARHPDKKIVINKATVKSARMALHRARKAARTSAAP